ncbi:MAG: phytase [Planctomycetota bacterium]|nr:phytase [Planctomycetota bacterium]
MTTSRSIQLAATSAAAALFALAGCTAVPPFTVSPTVETAPVASADDAADDPAIWVHPRNPSASLIIGTNKQQGLIVYDLAGREVQSLVLGRINNVDLRQNIRLAGRTIDLVVATSRNDQSVMLFEVALQPDATYRLQQLSPDRILTGFDEAYGVAIAAAPAPGDGADIYASSISGPVGHWRLETGPDNTIASRRLRTIPFATQTEGIVADETHGQLYVGEEDVGIWAVSLDPRDESLARLVRAVGPGTGLTADVEGLAVYHGARGEGYLVASSQGDNSFAVFKRRPPNTYLGSFTIVPARGIDGAEDTDGIAISSEFLGPEFRSGAMVVQDGMNGPDNQNFKIVPWALIAPNLPR